MFHTYGIFIQGLHYPLIKEKIVLLEKLWEESAIENETTQSKLEILITEINNMNLQAGNDKTGYNQIKDFKIIDGVCEFKFVS